MKRINNESLVAQYFNTDFCKERFDEKLLQYAHIEYYQTGETIINKGSSPNNIYVLVKGNCSASRLLANGQVFTSNTLNAPCLIGEIELLQLLPYIMNVKALTDCSLLVFPLNVSRDILINDNRFLRLLALDLAGKEMKQSIQLSQSYGYPLKTRLANFILNNSNNDIFKVKKVVIADYLGVSYRHVESIMKGFVDSGILKKEKLTYTITDKKYLLDLVSVLQQDY